MRISRRQDERAEKLQALKSVKILPTRQACTCRRGRASVKSPTLRRVSSTESIRSLESILFLVDFLKNEHFIKSKTQSKSQTVSWGWLSVTEIQEELKTSFSFPEHFKFRLLELKCFSAVFVDSAKTNVFNLAIEFVRTCLRFT